MGSNEDHTPQDETIGKVIASSKIKYKIGQGLYEGYHSGFKAKEIIKIYSSPTREQKNEIKERIKHLIKAHSEHYAKIRTIAELEDSFAVIMRDPEGQFLEDLLEKDTDISQRLKTAKHIAKGLRAIHGTEAYSLTQLHGAITPANIKITKNNQAILFNFYVHNADPKKEQKIIAPEVKKGRKPSTKSDIYELGALTYRLITGKYPKIHALKAELNEQPIHDDLKSIIIQSLEQLAVNRPTIGEILEQLESAKPDDTFVGSGTFYNAILDESKAKAFKLTYIQEPEKEHIRLEYTIKLKGTTFGRFSIGRDKKNDISIQGDKQISRQHAEIKYNRGTFYLQDESSANGTFLNEQQITKKILKNGDKIQIGSAKLIFTTL